MRDIRCPKCGTAFQVDENDYAAILSQVRNTEFEAELQRRVQELDLRHKAQEKAEALAARQSFERQLADKENEKTGLVLEIERLKGIIGGHSAEMKSEMARLSAEKDREIASLKARIEGDAVQHRLDLLNERNAVRDELQQSREDFKLLEAKLESERAEARNRVHEINENHQLQLRVKQEEIDRLKDFKTRLSTKMVGETLEIHCRTLFAQAQSMGLFPYAYFDKDNDVRGGTKGDFIFRDSVDGDEYISIMFEMKNEMDTTATKHRNTDFLEKLDKDRREKNCEYAVLVSMLERDSELYDQGIVDMSNLYPKMYVIRPQFFMVLISLLSRAGRKSLAEISGLRAQLEAARSQSIDVTNFERRRDQFVAAFGKLVEAHVRKHDEAIGGIDKVIESLEKQVDTLRKVKALFDTSEQKLIKANEAAENDFTIKKLTRGNPTMKAKFEEARQKAAPDEDIPEIQ